MTDLPLVTNLVKLPTFKLEPFAGDMETWARFWEQLESSIDKDPTLFTVNKHVFLRGYLEGEPKMLVHCIAVTAAAYEDTKILYDRYGDKNRIIQAHLDYLVTPIQFASAEALNITYIEYNRRIQALRELGENIKAYGRVLVPKILRAFPDDICRRWIIQVKREGHLEPGESKWRILFDGSFHEVHVPSLNYALEMGPNLLPEILATLPRFRL
jgi:hypothetical protein